MEYPHANKPAGFSETPQVFDNPMKTKPFPRPTQLLTLLCVLILVLSGCSRSPAKGATPIVATQVPAIGTSPSVTLQAPPSSAYWPTGGWRTSSPEEQGMDAQKLAQMLDAIQEQGLDLHSLLVIRHGYLVSETYFGYFKQDTHHELYSVTKSFVSTLIGIALDKGYIDRTDHRIVDFFSGYTFANLDSQKQAMTLEDVLTMRTGLDWHEGETAYQALYVSPDWVQFMLDEPMAGPPGAQFNYCSGCSHLLTVILKQTTGMNPRDFAEENLFKPLGISNASWELNPAGIPIGGWGLQLTPREMAKLGYLYLHAGQWDGQQVVSSTWVENATQKHTDAGGILGYGYQWWIIPSLGAYAALGLYGQTILVIPGSDLVIVTTAQTDNHDKIFQLILQYVVPAVLK
jgi:CubicO group peptidase (beta-lactamase class C family)